MAIDASKAHPIIQEFVAAIAHQSVLSREAIDDVIPLILRDAGLHDDASVLAMRQILTAQCMTVAQRGDAVGGLLTMFTLGVRLAKKGLI